MMNFKLLLSLGLLGFSLSSFAMQTVTLPDAATLTSRLTEVGQNHLVEKTNLVNKLADKTLAPAAVAIIVEISLREFLDSRVDYSPEMLSMESRLGQMSKSILFETIYKDKPEALELLKTQGFYTPIK